MNTPAASASSRTSPSCSRSSRFGSRRGPRPGGSRGAGRSRSGSPRRDRARSAPARAFTAVPAPRGQSAADRAAGEREQDVGDPVHPITSLWSPIASIDDPGGAEPGRAPPQPDEHGTEPGAEHEPPDEPRVDAHLGVRRLAGLDLTPSATRSRPHSRGRSPAGGARRRGCRRAGCGGGWTSTSRPRSAASPAHIRMLPALRPEDASSARV